MFAPLQVHVGTSHQEQRVVGYITCTHLHAIEGMLTRRAALAPMPRQCVCLCVCVSTREMNEPLPPPAVATETSSSCLRRHRHYLKPLTDPPHPHPSQSVPPSHNCPHIGRLFWAPPTLLADLYLALVFLKIHQTRTLRGGCGGGERRDTEARRMVLFATDPPGNQDGGLMESPLTASSSASVRNFSPGFCSSPAKAQT